MRATKAVREVMKDKEILVKDLARKMGKTPRLVSERLNQENISISKLMEMVRVMDYKIVLVPADEESEDRRYDIE